jgi:4-hydroxy-tetrahydrodipicolinate synthase
MNLTNYSLWTAVVTPLNSQGTVDYPALTKLLKEQALAENGILILGSTGEALNLSLENKKQIIHHTMELKLSVPVMAGVGGHQLEETLDWIHFLEQYPLSAYLMVTPLYAKPGAQGQYEWFKTLMDAGTKPVMLYNVPGRTACPLNLECVSRLANHPKFWSIKEASGSVEKFKEYLKAAGGKPVYCGDDALMPEFAMAGSLGLVSVAANAWPKATHQYVKMCLNKTFDDKELWTRASNSLFVASNPVPVKRLLFETGKISSPTMVAPLHHEDMKDITPIMEAHQAIKNWSQRMGL